ncbi:MAG: helix-turn-helix domain-containing protein [Paracoccaceae bacterium]
MSGRDGFHFWQHSAAQPVRHRVFPDGCRDVLVIRAADGPVSVRLTGFDLCPRQVVTDGGTAISGFRLRPGAGVTPDLLARVAGEPWQAAEILGNALGAWGEVDDTILALTLPGATAARVARDQGVSLRSLQRHFAGRALPPPEVWRLLGRARRAVMRLAQGGPLAEVACDAGFSDQAHMTRDLMRWFGATPARLRRDAGALAVLAQPALGNWTAEQISTR